MWSLASDQCQNAATLLMQSKICLNKSNALQKGRQHQSESTFSGLFSRKKTISELSNSQHPLLPHLQ